MKRPSRQLGIELSRAFMTVVLCAATFAGLAALGAPPVFARGQGPGNPEKINKVQSVSELRAATAEDRALASYFDHEGRSLLEGEGSIRIFPRAPVPVPPPPPGEAAQALPDPLPEIACGSDAIVVGQAVSSRTLLNRSETFLITVYQVAVGDWIRPARRGGTISVAMFGGDVLVEDRLLSARFRDPLAPGIPVLMFLSRVPGAPGLYKVAQPLPVVDGKIPETKFPAGASLTGPDGHIELAKLITTLRAHGSTCAARR